VLTRRAQLSWLNNTTGDPGAAPLLAEIVRLQDALDAANASVDAKLDALEDVGLDALGLTRQLADTRERAAALEEERARLLRREARRTRRLERARCGKCRTKVDVRLLEVGDDDERWVTTVRSRERMLTRLCGSSMDLSASLALTEPPTPPTRTSEALRTDLRAVNAELERMKGAWAAERRRLLGENAALARESEAAAVAGSELDKAKAAVGAFEAQLAAERARLRALTAEKGAAERARADVLAQLRRTDADAEGVKRELGRAKAENAALEKELRGVCRGRACRPAGLTRTQRTRVRSRRRGCSRRA
jgi:chromosome segregation ATPase